MCHKSKAFLLRRLENSGTYSTGNLSLCLFFIKEENEKVFGILKSKNSKQFQKFLSLAFSCKEKWVVDTIEEFIQNFYTFEYSGNQSIDTSDSKNEEEDDYQTTVLEPENEEDEEREKSQSDKIDLEIDKGIPIPIINYNRLINSILLCFFKK